MSPLLISCLGLLRLTVAMRNRHAKLAEMIYSNRAGNFPSERGWETFTITQGMKDAFEFDANNGEVKNVGGICPWQFPHSGEHDTILCEDGTYVTDFKCVKGGHGNRLQCPWNFPEMCKKKTCGGGEDYCCDKSCATNGGGLRESDGCEAAAKDLKHRFVNMIKDPVEDRWQPFSAPRMQAILDKWQDKPVVVTITEQFVDKNTIRACLDYPDWVDKQGDSCSDYQDKKYCASNGLDGEAWKGASEGHGLDHPSFVVSEKGAASDACCACGGGYYADPFAHNPTTTTTTTLAPTPATTLAPTPAPQEEEPEEHPAKENEQEPTAEAPAAEAPPAEDATKPTNPTDDLPPTGYSKGAPVNAKSGAMQPAALFAGILVALQGMSLIA